MGSGSWDIPYALYEPRRENAIKDKASGGGDHHTPSIVHMPLCMCICLYNLISSSIFLQHDPKKGIHMSFENLEESDYDINLILPTFSW